MTEAMRLVDWDRRVKPHLHMISAGADIVTRHVGALVGQPDFETIAGGDLDTSILILSAALRRLENAKRELANKPVVK